MPEPEFLRQVSEATEAAGRSQFSTDELLAYQVHHELAKVTRETIQAAHPKAMITAA